jgi:hypothetical protein
VEAAGVEPASEKRVPKASTCVALVYLFSPVALWKWASCAAASLACIWVRREAASHPSIRISVAEPGAADQAPGATSRLFRPRERSYRSQLLDLFLRAETRHASSGPLCSPSKPIRPHSWQRTALHRGQRAGRSWNSTAAATVVTILARPGGLPVPYRRLVVARSSRGPGRRPLTPITRVRIPYALPTPSLSQKITYRVRLQAAFAGSGAVTRRGLAGRAAGRGPVRPSRRTRRTTRRGCGP